MTEKQILKWLDQLQGELDVLKKRSGGGGGGGAVTILYTGSTAATSYNLSAEIDDFDEIEFDWVLPYQGTKHHVVKRYAVPIILLTNTAVGIGSDTNWVWLQYGIVSDTPTFSYINSLNVGSSYISKITGIKL